MNIMALDPRLRGSERATTRTGKRVTLPVLVSLSFCGLAGCTSPAYELSTRADSANEDRLVLGNDGEPRRDPSGEFVPAQPPGIDIPRMGEEIANLGLFTRNKPRAEILLAALSRYNITKFGDINLALNCDDGVQSVQESVVRCQNKSGATACAKPGTPGDTITTTSTHSPVLPGLAADKKGPTPAPQCVAISTGGSGAASPNVPVPVAAVLEAAVDECLFWTYKEDTTSISLNTLGTWLGVGLLAEGIVGAVHKWSTASTTALTAGGATVALAQKSLITPVPGSASSVIQAGLTYYPFVRAKASVLKAKWDARKPLGQKDNMTIIDEKVAALSALWDSAGSACGTGVLKGRSPINRVK
jgi:hypothetical protein